MSIFRHWRHPRFPDAIALFNLTLLFVISWHIPYYISDDAATLLKSAQQLSQGATPWLQSLTLPSVTDIAQDTQTWIVWYPPGMTLIYYPLIALGLPLGIAARITSYLLLISGSLGWLAIAKHFKIPQPVQIILACTLPLYAISVGGAVRLWNSELPPFGLLPWLYLYGLHLVARWKAQADSLCLRHVTLDIARIGLLAGSVYWLKYSAFTAAFALCIYIAIEFLFQIKPVFSWPQKLLALSVGGLTVAIPPMLLSGVNRALTQTVNIIEQSELSGFSPGHPRGWYMLLFILAVPSLYLFQGMFLWMHFVFFSDSWLPFFSNIIFQDRIIPLAILVLPISVSMVWLVWHHRHRFSSSLLLFAGCVGLLPILPLTYLSNRIGYNYLIFNPRHASYHFMVFEIIILTILWQALYPLRKKISQHSIKYWAVLLFVVIFPNLFHVSYFVKDYFIDQNYSSYIANAKRIEDRNMDSHNTAVLVHQIQRLIQQPKRDVVALAINNISAFSSWFIVNGRVLPLAHADEAFVVSHGRAMNIHSQTPFVTSEPLRVVLVVSRSIERDRTWFQTIKNRFPQATGWQKVPDQQLPESAVSIYFTDLVVEEGSPAGTN
jgi:hypothetical protein